MGQEPPITGAPPGPINPGALSKHERRLVFIQARRRGVTTKEAARLAGVKEETGYKWNRVLRAEEAKSAARASVADKSELGTVLTSILRDPETRPADRVKSADLVADLIGAKAPTRSLNVNVQAPPGWSDWARELDRRMLGLPDEQPQIAANPNSDTPQRLLPQGLQAGSHNGSYRTLPSPSADGGDLEKAGADPQTKVADDE